jgi:hypothetical protein
MVPCCVMLPSLCTRAWLHAPRPDCHIMLLCLAKVYVCATESSTTGKLQWRLSRRRKSRSAFHPAWPAAPMTASACVAALTCAAPASLSRSAASRWTSATVSTCDLSNVRFVYITCLLSMSLCALCACVVSPPWKIAHQLTGAVSGTPRANLSTNACPRSCCPRPAGGPSTGPARVGTL